MWRERVSSRPKLPVSSSGRNLDANHRKSKCSPLKWRRSFHHHCLTAFSIVRLGTTSPLTFVVHWLALLFSLFREALSSLFFSSFFNHPNPHWLTHWLKDYLLSWRSNQFSCSVGERDIQCQPVHKAHACSYDFSFLACDPMAQLSCLRSFQFSSSAASTFFLLLFQRALQWLITVTTSALCPALLR